MIQDRLRIPEGLPQRMAMINFVNFPQEQFVLLTHTSSEFCVGSISLGKRDKAVNVYLKKTVNFDDIFIFECAIKVQSFNSLQLAAIAAANQIVIWQESYHRVNEQTLVLPDAYRYLVDEGENQYKEEAAIYKINRLNNNGPLSLAVQALEVRAIGMIYEKGFMFEIKKIFKAVGLSWNQSFLSEN